MSAVYENENKEVCVQLISNDYILISNATKSVTLKITNIRGKLHVETYKEKKSKKKRNE